MGGRAPPRICETIDCISFSLACSVSSEHDTLVCRPCTYRLIANRGLATTTPPMSKMTALNVILSACLACDAAPDVGGRWPAVCLMMLSDCMLVTYQLCLC